MMSRFLLAFGLLPILVLAPPAIAGKYTEADKARMWLCSAARGDHQIAGKNKAEVLIHLLNGAAGVDPARDSDEVKREKLSTFWKNPALQERKNTGVYCYNTLGNGTLLWQTVDRGTFDLLPILLKMGADINMIDVTNGRTVLDELTAFYDWNSFHDETEWVSPRLRRSEDYSLRTARTHYVELREMGARHAAELPTLQSSAQREAACLTTEPGDAPQEYSDYPGGLATKFGALTPKAIEGATTVSPRQAACLIRALGPEMFVMHAMRDEEGLPGARKYLAATMAGTFDDEAQKVVNTFKRISDVDKPVLVYCHSDKCFLSYNSVLRLLKAGTKRVYWMRDGINGWKAAGYPVTRADGFLIGERN